MVTSSRRAALAAALGPLLMTALAAALTAATAVAAPAVPSRSGPTPAVATVVGGSVARAVAASGEFEAVLDVTSLGLREITARSCELTVDGELVFRGTLAGIAEGSTRALVLAPCAQVATTPPGTFVDVFRFVGTFSGTVDGTAAEGGLTYAGVTKKGGDIDAAMTLRAEVTALLRVQAVVAEGGTYTGVAKA